MKLRNTVTINDIAQHSVYSKSSDQLIIAILNNLQLLPAFTLFLENDFMDLSKCMFSIHSILKTASIHK